MIVLIDKFLKRTDNFGFGFGGMAEWLKATDCKSVLSEYVGSNPTPSTIFDFVSLISPRTVNGSVIDGVGKRLSGRKTKNEKL